ncbi:MAG: hypothetical protein D6714_16920, partial [Bacteroidetes bacterium]
MAHLFGFWVKKWRAGRRMSNGWQGETSLRRFNSYLYLFKYDSPIPVTLFEKKRRESFCLVLL